jgi:hypothetical protein
LAICLLLFASLLTPFATAGNGSGTINTFADGNTTVQVNLNGGTLDTSNAIALERNTTITSATFDIDYSHTSPSPGSVTLDIAEDGLYEWAWTEMGFGDLGNQTTFSDGSTTNSSSVGPNGAQLELVFIPRAAQLQTSDLTVEYSPDFGGGWVVTGQIDDLAVGDVDADSLPEPIFLQRAHTWANGSSSPAIGYFDWSPSTGFSAVSWNATCDGATTLYVGDFDGDGRADVAATDATNESACIHMSQSSGGWSNSTNLTLGQGFTDLAVGDLDSDGADELVSVHGDGTLREFVFNPTNGSFGLGAQTTVTSNGSGMQAVLSSVVTGQFWGSGNPTVAVSDGMDGHVSLWNSSNGSWVQLITNTSFDCIKSGLMTLDWNGDGLLDLLGNTDMGVCVSTFNGSGWSIQLDNSTQLNNHSVGDWNGNGSDDLLQPLMGTPDGNDATFTGSLAVHSFDANGSVATTVRSLTPHTAPREVLLADLDGDGMVEQLVVAGEATRGLYLAGYHSVSFDFDSDGQLEGTLVGYAGDGQNGVDKLTWFDMGNITQSLTSKIPFLPSQLFPYGIEMGFVIPDATSTGRGTVLLKDLSLTYDASFTVDANLMLGNLTNSLNLQMLPGSGPFNVTLPFNSSKAGTLTLESLQVEWSAGMSGQSFRPAPVINNHAVWWDPANATHRVIIMWNDAAMFEADFLAYQIFRWVNGSPPQLGTPHQTSPGNGTMDEDNVSGTTWDYRVRAVYSSGVFSNLSDVVTITVPPLPAPDLTPPDAATGLTAVDTASDNGGYIDVAWTESTSNDVSWYAVYLDAAPITDASGLTEVANVSTGDSTSLTIATIDVTDYYVAVVCGDYAGNVNWNAVTAGPVQSLNNSVRGSSLSVSVVTGATSENSLADALAGAGLPFEITVQLQSEGVPAAGEQVSVDLHTWGSSGIWNVTSQQIDAAWTLSGVTDSAGEASWNWSDWVDLQSQSPTLLNWVSQVTASYDGGSWSATQQTIAASSGGSNFESRVEATLGVNVSTVQLDEDGEGMVTVQLYSAAPVEQPLLRGIVVDWSLGNESNQATASNGQVSVGIDGTAEILIHYPQGGELDLTVETSTLQWLDLADDEERVILLPPLEDGDGGGGEGGNGNQNQPDPELLQLEMSCEEVAWNLRENGSVSTKGCTIRNPNQVRVTVDVTVGTPIGMDIFFSPATSFSLTANKSTEVSLEMRALLRAPAGDRQLQVALTASAAGYADSHNSTTLNFTVIPLTSSSTDGGTDGGESAGMSTLMLAAIALVVLALLGGGFVGLRSLRSEEEEEEEADGDDWLEDVADPEGSTADFRRAPPRQTKPLDDEFSPMAKRTGWMVGEEGGLPARGKTGARPSSRPAPVGARPHRQEATWDDGYEEQDGGEDDYTESEDYHVDDDGVEWWKDEVGVWWYRYPDEDEWSEFIE